MSENLLPEIYHDELYDLSMSVTSDARANGQATNSATARLCRHGAPSRRRWIDFEVTGSARFTNGARLLSIQTDEQGYATVFFTDTLAERVGIIARVDNNLLIYQASFIDGDVAISVQVWANNVPADNISKNQLLYRVFNRSTNEPIADAAMDFSVTGQANLSVASAITNQDGVFLLSAQKVSPGSVLVSAQVRHVANADNHTFLTFSDRRPRYRLTSQVQSYQPGRGIPVLHTLIDLNTGLGVPNEALRIHCGNQLNFLHFTHPTLADGTRMEWYGVSPGASVPMLATMRDDETVNASFTLIG